MSREFLDLVIDKAMPYLDDLIAEVDTEAIEMNKAEGIQATAPPYLEAKEKNPFFFECIRSLWRPVVNSVVVDIIQSILVEGQEVVVNDRLIADRVIRLDLDRIAEDTGLVPKDVPTVIYAASKGLSEAMQESDHLFEVDGVRFLFRWEEEPLN